MQRHDGQPSSRVNRYSLPVYTIPGQSMSPLPVLRSPGSASDQSSASPTQDARHPQVRNQGFHQQTLPSLEPGNAGEFSPRQIQLVQLLHALRQSGGHDDRILQHLIQNGLPSDLLLGLDQELKQQQQQRQQEQQLAHLRTQILQKIINEQAVQTEPRQYVDQGQGHVHSQIFEQLQKQLGVRQPSPPGIAGDHSVQQRHHRGGHDIQHQRQPHVSTQTSPGVPAGWGGGGSTGQSHRGGGMHAQAALAFKHALSQSPSQSSRSDGFPTPPSMPLRSPSEQSPVGSPIGNLLMDRLAQVRLNVDPPGDHSRGSIDNGSGSRSSSEKLSALEIGEQGFNVFFADADSADTEEVPRSMEEYRALAKQLVGTEMVNEIGDDKIPSLVEASLAAQALAKKTAARERSRSPMRRSPSPGPKILASPGAAIARNESGSGSWQSWLGSDDVGNAGEVPVPQQMQDLSVSDAMPAGDPCTSQQQVQTHPFFRQANIPLEVPGREAGQGLGLAEPKIGQGEAAPSDGVAVSKEPSLRQMLNANPEVEMSGVSGADEIPLSQMEAERRNSLLRVITLGSGAWEGISPLDPAVLEPRWVPDDLLRADSYSITELLGGDLQALPSLQPTPPTSSSLFDNSTGGMDDLSFTTTSPSGGMFSNLNPEVGPCPTALDSLSPSLERNPSPKFETLSQAWGQVDRQVPMDFDPWQRGPLTRAVEESHGPLLSGDENTRSSTSGMSGQSGSSTSESMGGSHGYARGRMQTWGGGTIDVSHPAGSPQSSRTALHPLDFGGALHVDTDRGERRAWGSASSILAGGHFARSPSQQDEGSPGQGSNHEDWADDSPGADRGQEKVGAESSGGSPWTDGKKGGRKKAVFGGTPETNKAWLAVQKALGCSEQTQEAEEKPQERGRSRTPTKRPRPEWNETAATITGSEGEYGSQVLFQGGRHDEGCPGGGQKFAKSPRGSPRATSPHPWRQAELPAQGLTAADLGLIAMQIKNEFPESSTAVGQQIAADHGQGADMSSSPTGGVDSLACAEAVTRAYQECVQIRQMMAGSEGLDGGEGNKASNREDPQVLARQMRLQKIDQRMDLLINALPTASPHEIPLMGMEAQDHLKRLQNELQGQVSPSQEASPGHIYEP